MNEMIGGRYQRVREMQTTGSGSARWCTAVSGGETFFVKQFLSPVYPTQPDTPLGKRQLERCLRFEARKQRLYQTASCVLGDVLVPVVDFFRENGHYYAVSEAITADHLTLDQTADLQETEKQQILYELALCLQRLHAQGIVHADLKPEHVLLIQTSNGWKVKLIDLDSGFMTDELPETSRELEGDPAYLAPEAFLRIAGEMVALGTAMDIFAFGAMFHQVWTGELPAFDHSRYHYLCEAALAGEMFDLLVPEVMKPLVRRMLDADAKKRPTAVEITSVLCKRKQRLEAKPRSLNGLTDLMKR